MFKGNVVTAGISFVMSRFRLHAPITAMSDVRDMTVYFAMATLYLQKRDERRGVNHLAGTNGDFAWGDGGASVALLTSGEEGNDRGDGVPETFQPRRLHGTEQAHIAVWWPPVGLDVPLGVIARFMLSVADERIL